LSPIELKERLDRVDGYTLISILKEIKEQYDLDKIVFVANAGMFSKDNLKEFEKLYDKESKITYSAFRA
jgi:transposase